MQSSSAVEFALSQMRSEDLIRFLSQNQAQADSTFKCAEPFVLDTTKYSGTQDKGEQSWMN